MLDSNLYLTPSSKDFTREVLETLILFENFINSGLSAFTWTSMIVAEVSAASTMTLNPFVKASVMSMNGMDVSAVKNMVRQPLENNKNINPSVKKSLV